MLSRFIMRVPVLDKLYARIWLYLRFSENTILAALAVSVGLACGIGVWVYRAGIDFFHGVFREDMAHQVSGMFGAFSIVIVLAGVGLLVGWIRQRFIGEERHHGVAGIMEAVALGGGRLRYRVMPFKALASALSLGAGASLGPEDPSVQIGANLGSFFGQRLYLSEERVRLLVGAGAASAIAAAFNAPIAGVFFALEVILNGEFTTGSFGIVVLASVVSSVFTQAAGAGGAEMGLLNYTLGNPLEIPFYVILGLLLGPIAAGFIRAVYWQHDLWHHRVRVPAPVKTALAGALVGLVAIWLPDILGTGHDAMNDVLNGEEIHDTILFLMILGVMKLLMTTVSLAGGFVGGVFAPTLFVGTMLGGAFGQIVGLIGDTEATGDPQAYAIAGMAAMMAGVVRAPITAVLLVFELTNDYNLILPIMLTTVVCVSVTERIEPSGVYALGLLRKGVKLPQSRDVDVMQSITVGEALLNTLPATIPESATLLELRDSFRRYERHSLCVVDQNGSLTGVVTLTDLQRAYTQEDHELLTVGDICSRNPVTISPDAALWKAIRDMGTYHIGYLPVIRPDTQELAGILSREDVLHAYNIAIAQKRSEQHLAEQVRLHTLTGAHTFEIPILPGSPVVSQLIRDVDIPDNCLIVSIRRNERLVVPHGETQLKSGDWLTILASPEQEKRLAALFGHEAE